MFRSLLKVFWTTECAQDLAEYCLITALVALIALGIIYQVSGGMQGLWDTANTTLAAGKAATSSGSAGGGSPAAASATASSH